MYINAICILTLVYLSFLAHKLALHDLGKAIAIHPVGADNYYLRGDCHSKLGNYEQVRMRLESICLRFGQ